MRVVETLLLKSTVIILCLILTSFGPEFKVVTHHSAISIEDALMNNWISCDIVSNGGHKEECINLKVGNLRANRLVLRVESGRNFESVDTNLQDIIVVREELIVLNGNEKKEVNIYGFCSQSSNSSPSEGDLYSIGSMKSKNIVKLTEHLAVKEYPISAMQKAIWTVTDNTPIASIFDANRDTILDLQAFVSDLTNQTSPWYSIEYKENEENLFTGEAKRVYGTMQGNLSANTVVKIVVHDMLNYSALKGEFVVQEDSYNHNISFDVSTMPKGRYHVGIYALGVGRIDEKVINI